MIAQILLWITSHYVTSRQVALKLRQVCVNFYVCNITARQCSFNKVKTLTGSLTAHVIIYRTSIRSGGANTAVSENSIPAEKPTAEK